MANYSTKHRRARVWAGAPFALGVIVVLVVPASSSALPRAQTSGPTVPSNNTAATVPSITRATGSASSPSGTVRKTTKRAVKTTKRASSSSTSSSTMTWRVANAGPVGLAVRLAPSTDAKMLVRLKDGATIKVVCQATGSTVRMSGGAASSDIWDKLSSGGYVSHLYTTGYLAGKGRVLKSCVASTPTTTTAASGVAASSTTGPVSSEGP